MILFYECASESNGNHFIDVFQSFYLRLSAFFRLCKETSGEELKIKASLVWLMIPQDFALTIQRNGGTREAALKLKAVKNSYLMKTHLEEYQSLSCNLK